jgi:predicted metal-dependent phosphoesterase TrpH
MATRKGLSAIAVTDHETVRGAKETIKQNRVSKDLFVIPGIEIKTEVGDIVGLFVEEDVAVRDVLEVIDCIKEQDGLVVLSHPARLHKNLDSQIMLQIDLVEGLNGRSSCSENLQAKNLALLFNKPVIGGSDAHFSFEIGCVRTRLFGSVADLEDLRKLIENSERELVGKESPFFVHIFSFEVEIIKKIMHHRGVYVA